MGKAGRHPWTSGFLLPILKMHVYSQHPHLSKRTSWTHALNSTHNMKSKSAKGMQEMLSIQCSAKQKPSVRQLHYKHTACVCVQTQACTCSYVEKKTVEIAHKIKGKW